MSRHDDDPRPTNAAKTEPPRPAEERPVPPVPDPFETIFGVFPGPAQGLTGTPANVPTHIPADLATDLSTDLPSDLPSDLPPDLPSELRPYTPPPSDHDSGHLVDWTLDLPSDDSDGYHGWDGRSTLPGQLTAPAGWMPGDTAAYLRVRSMTSADLRRTARWHRDLLPHAFFTSLGTGFVRRWHLSYLDSPHAIALIAERTDMLPAQPVAFLIGSSDQRAHTAHTLTHHRSALAARAIMGMSMRPGVLVRFVRTRLGRYLRRLASASPHQDRMPSRHDGHSASGAGGRPVEPLAVVTAIAVEPRLRGTGVGRRLLEAFEAEAARHGTRRAELVTRADSAAEVFYDQCGWSRLPVRRNRDGAPTTPFSRDLTCLAGMGPDRGGRRRSTGIGGFDAPGCPDSSGFPKSPRRAAG